jgi:hypothetical protein
MNTRRILLTTAVVVAGLMSIVAGLRSPSPVRAQGDIPPPVPDRISFGSVGITSGQTLRVSVSNTIMPGDVNLPPGPVRVVMNFRLPNGNLVRDARTGDVVRRVVDLERGDSAFVDLDYADLPPSPIRAQIRPVVVTIPPPVNDSTQNPMPRDAVVSTVEVILNSNGRSQFAVFTHPAVARGFNPQPDPPSPE